ncbi:MAG: oligosaccharide flippase family protein, partial [Anaerolineales bacterium]
MFSHLTSIWRDDTILRRVVKNSGHLLSGSAISAALGLFQTILTKQMLDIGIWGLVGVIVLFATNINRLLSFRMSEVVVQRLGAALPEGKTDEAAAAVKAAMLTEAATSIAAFVSLVALTPWAAVYFGKNIQTAPLFLLYGLILLSNIIAESSTGVLQALRRFNWIARINIVQSVITTAIMLFVFFTHGGIPEIILTYTIGKTINGIGLALFALRELHQTLGAGWWKTPLDRVSDKRKMFSFMVNSNLNGTVYLFTRDSMALILAHILGTAEAGYFNVALTMVNFMTLPLDPLINPTYAEIIHTVALKQWDATRQLLRRVSLISASVVFSMSAVLALTGWFVIPLFLKADAAPAYPALLILLIGYGFACIFQWNRPLLLALGKPGYPVLVALITGLAELALIAWLVPHFGYLA